MNYSFTSLTSKKALENNPFTRTLKHTLRGEHPHPPKHRDWLSHFGQGKVGSTAIQKV